MRRFLIAFAVMVLWLSSSASAADVRAWLDRDTAHLGETVTLNVEASGVGNAMPDFSALGADFEQLGTSSSSSVNIVNGTTTAKQLWAVGLQPKREGRIEIAPIAVGSARSEALVLTVQAAPTVASGHAGDEVFVEMQAEPDSPYVQQQVRVTVALYFAVNLADGNLEEPRVDGAVVQKLGQDRNYQAQRNGRTYRVIERHYALLPEKSGALELRALNFRGRAIGNDPSAGFFGRGREIGARSEAITLTVRPRPAAATGAWLPAQSVDYAVNGPDATASSRVGEPITLTASLRAQGLGFEQLPEIALPKIDGAEVYPDKPVTRTRDDGTWLYGESERKFAIVPTRAGRLHIPESTLSWWNTAQDKAETITIPARDIDVAAAAATSGTAPAVPEAVNVGSAPATATTPASITAPGAAESVVADAALVASASRWRIAALSALMLWLATVTAWFFTRRRRAATIASVDVADTPTARAAKAQFERACDARDVAAIAAALVAWARAEGHAVTHLSALAQQLADAQQRELVRALERARFGNGAAPDAREFKKSFTRLVWLRENTQSATSPLPPLYP